MENVTLTQQEQARLQVLNNLLAGYMTTGAGIDVDGSEHTPHQAHTGGIRRGRSSRTSSRQSRSQTCQRYTERIGERSSTSGAQPIRRSQPYAPERVAEGARGYRDIGRDTLRKILANAGVSSPRRRRPPKHRVRRQRMPREGMLIQVDGSYHRWLGEDGPQFTLLLAVDDATGVVADALFCELENTHSYFSLLDGLIRRCGIPIALYADRHAVFKYTPPSEAAAAPTQFSRAIDELGIQLIFARSPQAKGRVERMAGTFQDRLVTELRLAEAATIDDANRVLADFLPRFNQRFRVPPQHAETAYRVLDPQMCLDTTLCLKYRRRVGRDNTVKYRWRTLQLLPGTDRPSYAGAVVDVLEGLDGQLAVQHEGQIIPTQEAPQHRSAPISCATSPREPRILLRLITTAMAWADAGQTSLRNSTSMYLATLPTVTLPEEFARL